MSVKSDNNKASQLTRVPQQWLGVKTEIELTQHTCAEAAHQLNIQQIVHIY